MTVGPVPFDPRAVLRHFQVRGEFVSAAPHGNGHINDTYAVVLRQDGGCVRYTLQRINRRIFTRIEPLMRNIERVCAHVRTKLVEEGAEEIDRRTLTLVPAHDGRAWHADADGNHWRLYLFIEHASTVERDISTLQAREAGRAFGRFQRQLADLPPPALETTIPEFHHTRRRFEALRAAIEADPRNRAAGAQPEIEFVLAREAMVDVLFEARATGRIPERVTHNDAKLNNVLLDDATSEGLCVIDLDTVMPGVLLFDFGDLCRTATRPTAGDETDLARVELRMDLFEALVQGYLSMIGDRLVPAERDLLAHSAALITLETGIRFLTDYLEGDRYFKTGRPAHNLDRCRVQFKMVDSFERHRAAMERFVASA
jgi:aminoglycoside phosphotransferase (APT) family kinase protein